MKQSLMYWNLEDYTYSLSEYIEELIKLNHKIDSVVITKYVTEFKTKSHTQEYMFATNAIIITSKNT